MRLRYGCMVAPVHLPHGASVTDLFGHIYDNDATRNASLSLRRVAVDGSSATTMATVPTAGNSTSVQIVGDASIDNDVVDNLAFSYYVTVCVGSSNLRLYAASVRIRCAFGAHSVRIRLPSDSGSAFFPLTGYRAYDSRLEMAPVPDGRLGAGPGRVIPVKDGRNVGTGLVDLPDAIPADATAVAFTVTVVSTTSSGFLFVGPGDATAITASSINWDSTTSGALANSGIVQLDSSSQIRVFAGGSPTANTHFIIDVSGYYAPTG